MPLLERLSDWLHEEPSGPAMTPKVISVVSGRGILGVMVVGYFFFFEGLTVFKKCASFFGGCGVTYALTFR